MTRYIFTPVAAAAKHAFVHHSEHRPAQPTEAAPSLPSLAVAAMVHTLAQTESGELSPEEAFKAEDSEEPLAGEDAATEHTAHLRNRRLAVLVGSRIVAAREWSGLQQRELAREIGHATPAQPNLWESGRRLIPLPDVLTVAKALGVSTDFLLGMSEELDREPAVARREVLVQHLRHQLETVAGHLADAALESGAELEGVMRAHGFVSKAVGMARAVQRFEAANASTFDDLPAGALLRLAARKLADATAPVSAELDAVAMRRERAARKAKMALSHGAT